MKDRRGLNQHVKDVEESLDDEDDHDVELADLAPPSFGHTADNKLLEDKLCYLLYEEMKRVNSGGGPIVPLPAIQPIGTNNTKVQSTTSSSAHRKEDSDEDDSKYEDGEDSGKPDDPVSKLVDELEL